MKLPDVYTIGRYFESWVAALATALSFGVLTFAVAVGEYYSPENIPHTSNRRAAEKFVYTVETDFPGNRVSVLYALRDMRVAYEQTGESDPARLRQLERLEDWLIRSHTAGEEQLFLTEVRLHGEVAADGPWFNSWRKIMGSIFIACVFGLALFIMARPILCRMDPRLRQSRAIGN